MLTSKPVPRGESFISAAGGSGNSNATAELTWGLILSALRNLPYEVRRLKEGQWQSTLGIGSTVKHSEFMPTEKSAVLSPASAKRSARESSVGAAKARPAAPKPLALKLLRAGEEFFAGADILSLHLPLNKDTRGIVTRDDLARMKPTALIVNPSRAGLIAQGALADALRGGRPGMAAVDVYEEEPVSRRQSSIAQDG